MPSGSQDDRTLARRVKHGVATTVRSMPKGFRERVANLVLPPDERSVTGPVDAPEVIRRGAEIPFEVWEQHGWHLTPNHFYSVIPDTRVLPDSLWTTESELPGIDMRDEAQLAFLTDAVGRFGTATLHYQWQKANGRIHTGSVPPAGAAVFFTSTTSAGHIMLSIGGNSAISTGPTVYQTNTFRQRSDYLGWAYVPSSW